MKNKYIDATSFYPSKGKHAEKHTKIRSNIPEFAIAKVEKAVAKRLRKWKRDLNLLKMTSQNF